MNTIKKIWSLLLGISIMTSMPYACKDDDESNSKMQEQLDQLHTKVSEILKNLAAAVKKTAEQSEVSERVAETIEKAAEMFKETPQETEKIAATLASAAEMITEYAQEQHTTAESVLKELTEAVESKEQSPSETGMDEILKTLQEIIDLITDPGEGSSTG